MPEVHGCGEAARKASREAWLKAQQTKLHPFTSSSKPMTEEKRKVLHHQLQKKIAKQVDSRSAKKPATDKKGKK